MKANELREMTDEELKQRQHETQQELFNLRLQQTSGQLENPLRIRHLRRELARVQTIMSERSKAER
jgi:large subunit ribosomal protein L29